MKNRRVAVGRAKTEVGEEMSGGGLCEFKRSLLSDNEAATILTLEVCSPRSQAVIVTGSWDKEKTKTPSS